MNTDVDSEFHIIQPSDAVRHFCKSELTFPNPEYVKKIEQGFWVGDTPKNVVMYRIVDGAYVIPFGCVQALKPLLHGTPVTRWFSPLRARRYVGGIELRPYQDIAVSALLDARNGILEAPCGSGKTEIGLAAVARLGCRALWLAHTRELVRQSYDRACRMYGTDGMGLSVDGRVDIGDRMTFACINTAKDKFDYTELGDHWDMVIVDECHRVSASAETVSMYDFVLSHICARYKLGLSATPKRTDGLYRTTQALLGPVVHTIVREDVSEHLCPVQVRMVACVPNVDIAECLNPRTQTVDWSRTISQVCGDTERTRMIASIASSLDGPALVLSSRLKHLADLREMCGRGSIAVSGKARPKDDLMFATYQLLSEGFDMPDLRYIIMACPVGNEKTIIQSCGRVARQCEGKTVGTVIDIQDDCNLFKKYNETRMQIYRRLKYEILE